MKPFPTIEQYGELAKEKARKFLDEEDQQEVERFLKSQDAADAIEDGYESSKKRYEDGECTLRAAFDDGANSAAYCLYMLFE